MNILFVNDIPFNPVAGGLERVTDVLTKELVKRGYTIYYLCGKLPESKKYLLDYNFPVQLFQLPKNGMFADGDNVLFYKQLQSDLNIEIVINQRGLDGLFNGLLTITQSQLISVVHSIPDAGVIMFLNQLVELTTPPFASFKRNIKKIFPSLFLSYWRRKFQKELRVKYNDLAINSDVIVTLSPKCVETLEGIIDVPHKYRIVSIPNPNSFKVEGISFDTKSKVILYVGRLSKQEKEPLRLLEIWRYLYKKHQDWCLKIVGDGEEERKMRDYVNVHCLKNVYFEGRQSDVIPYYKESSFVCLTSNLEGWGMALTEGMQYGCIPFTFDNYGAAFDIIDDDVNGCLIPAFDLKEYAKRLAELMSNDAKRLKMSKAAIEKVKEFSVENVADTWEELFINL